MHFCFQESFGATVYPPFSVWIMIDCTAWRGYIIEQLLPRVYARTYVPHLFFSRPSSHIALGAQTQRKENRPITGAWRTSTELVSIFSQWLLQPTSTATESVFILGLTGSVLKVGPQLMKNKQTIKTKTCTIFLKLRSFFNNCFTGKAITIQVFSTGIWKSYSELEQATVTLNNSFVAISLGSKLCNFGSPDSSGSWLLAGSYCHE